MINKEIELIIDKICRCCMCENENMHTLFEDADNSNESAMVSLSEMLNACASVEVKSEDALPNTLCKTCEEKLKSFYAFRIQCQKSDTTLRGLIQNDIKKVGVNKNAIPSNNSNAQLVDEDDLPLLQRSQNDSTTDSTIGRKRGRPKGKKSEAPYRCPYCSKHLHTATGLRKHFKVHSSQKEKQCLFCDAKYARLNHLMRHIASHDKPDKKHPCEHCDMTFGLAVDLYKHSKEHEQDTPRVEVKQEEYIVEDTAGLLESIDTNQSFNDEKMSFIEEEIKENVEASYQEEVVEQSAAGEQSAVGEEFSIDDGLGDNLDESDSDIATNDEQIELNKMQDEPNETSQISQDQYKCDICLKVLSTPKGLKVHMRRHTGTSSLDCKLCGKFFAKKSHLARHMHIHVNGDSEKFKELESKGLLSTTLNQVMECDYCDRKFKYRKSFVNHMQVEHGISDTEVDAEKVDLIAERMEEDREAVENIIDTNTKTGEVEIQQVTPTDCMEQAPHLLTEGQEVDTIMHNDENNIDDPSDPNLITEDNFGLSKKARTKNQICHVCNASFARVNHLTRHMILHRNVLIHQCERCDKAFATEEFLKQHFEGEHINKPYVCTVCNKPFSRGEHLIRHLKVHQTDTTSKERLKCSICELTFAKSDLLARHTKIHLLQDKRHVCIECGKAFNRLDNLKTHQRIHTGVKDTSKLHLCIYCGKEFNNSSNMIVHMRRHTGERPYKCNECGKGFPRSHDLKCHERTHSGEKPYLCTLCGKSFNKSNKLLRHSRVHTGERPYVCNICGRAFTQSNDLSLHMRRHTGARPYACGVCPARFIQSGQLKAHKRTTGHWIETQPDLKGGHRVEPVTPAHEPTPIRFKSHKLKREGEISESAKTNVISVTPVENLQEVPQEEHHTTVTLTEVQSLSVPPQRILMGIMSNIKLQNEPLLIDSTKLVELHTTGLMNLPSVIQTANGEELKLKSEVANFTITQCADGDIIEKQEDDAARVFEDGAVIYSTVGHTSTTYTAVIQAPHGTCSTEDVL